jgi:hypothetical protein
VRSTLTHYALWRIILASIRIRAGGRAEELEVLVMETKKWVLSEEPLTEGL